MTVFRRNKIPSGLQGAIQQDFESILESRVTNFEKLETYSRGRPNESRKIMVQWLSGYGLGQYRSYFFPYDPDLLPDHVVYVWVYYLQGNNAFNLEYTQKSQIEYDFEGDVLCFLNKETAQRFQHDYETANLIKAIDLVTEHDIRCLQFIEKKEENIPDHIGAACMPYLIYHKCINLNEDGKYTISNTGRLLVQRSLARPSERYWWIYRTTNGKVAITSAQELYKATDQQQNKCI